MLRLLNKVLMLLYLGSGHQDAGQRTPGGHVLRRGQEALSHQVHFFFVQGSVQKFAI
jgi:hypothetical protein